jgi:DNA helicase-2/ATP-dependent DNA helicase PcrA
VRRPNSSMANHLTLAVAGSRKTQGIVDYCATLPTDRTALVLTFTQANQLEVTKRMARYAGNHLGIVVMGWFAFLLRHFARPFLPFKFRNKRVLGFNYDGRPYQMASGYNRFFDSSGAAYGCELGRLSNELVAASGGTLLRRLECIFDEILIDEVQDLSSHDWEIVDVLLNSSIEIRMVGDVRQSVISTNARSSKNKKYAYANAISWFREREAKGLLKISESSTTWRCRQEIAEFSDSIFDPSWLFSKTHSVNENITEHDGVFLVRSKDAAAYVEKFRPQCLRHSVSSGKKFEFDFMNFKVSKGATFERVLIVPTDGVTKFVQKGIQLEPIAAASFYVAVTRAQQSVAFVVDKPVDSKIPYWVPQ